MPSAGPSDRAVRSVLYRPVLEGRPAVVSFVTVAELEYGARLAGWRPDRRRRLKYEVGRDHLAWAEAHEHARGPARLITTEDVMTAPFAPKQIAPGEGKTVMLFGVRFSYKIESGDCGGSLAILEVEIPARTLVKPHSHTREDEFTFVISGTVGARVGDRVLEAGPGAYLAKPRGIPHAMWNTGNGPATVAEILSPGGLEGYFEELAPILSEHRTPPEYYQLAESYGITIQDDWIPELESRYGVKL